MSRHERALNGNGLSCSCIWSLLKKFLLRVSLKNQNLSLNSRAVL